jgi:hypothetical protein
MKLVTLTTDMRGWGRGDNALLPDEVADKLVANGEATNPRRWPAEPSIADLPMLTTPLRPDPPPEAKPRRRYLTK